MQYSDVVLNAILDFWSYSHTCFTVIQISQVSSTWILSLGTFITHRVLNAPENALMLWPTSEMSMKRTNYKLTRIIMTEHLMLWIVSYTFLEMSTNWLSSNRCTVFLLKLSNAILTWLINSGITIKKKKKQNTVSIKRIEHVVFFLFGKTRHIDKNFIL